MREERTTTRRMRVRIVMADIGALEFNQMFSESDNEEAFSGFEVDNSDSDLDFSDISSVSSDQSDVEDDAREASDEEQIWTGVHSDIQIEKGEEVWDGIALEFVLLSSGRTTDLWQHLPQFKVQTSML